jgi:hypothetical protein
VTRKRAHTGARICVLALSMLAGLVLLCGATAQAKTVHVPGGSFGSEGSGPGQLNEPLGVAVNDSTEPLAQPAAGDVYVVDKGNNRVERFSATGEYLGQFDGSGTFEVEGKVETGTAAPTGAFSEPARIAVDNSGSLLDPSDGDVYVVDNGHGVIDKFTETGEYVGQLTGRCEREKESPPCTSSKFIAFAPGQEGIVGAAIDPTGMLWVDESNGSIENFNDALVNEYISTRETVFGSGISNLEADAEGNLYLSRGHAGNIKVNDSGETLVNPFGVIENTSDIAVDPTHGEVYTDYGTAIGAFTLGGLEIEQFGSGDLALGQFPPSTASRAVAVDASDGTVYASDFAASDVVVFDAVALPSVSLGALSEQTPRSVTLNGTVSPEGSPVTSCVFEYVAASEYEPSASNPYVKGAKVPCSPAAGELGSGSSPVPVSARLPGLVPEARYHYRLVAENGAHISSPTLDREFTTGPVLGGEFVTNVASSSATLGVGIDPNGDDAHYYLRYGTSVSYGAYAPVEPPGLDLGSGTETRPVSLHLQGLQSGTVYHYRFVTMQNGEEFAEPDRTFTTQGATSGPALADARAWELVSPGDNKGALIEPFVENGDQIQAASDGHGVTYLVAGSLGEEPRGRINWSQVLSVRAGTGWRSEDLTVRAQIPGNKELPGTTVPRPEYRVFSPALSAAVVVPVLKSTPPLSAEAPERTIYLRDNLHGGFTPLVRTGNVVNPEELNWGAKSEEQLYFVTATPDLGHVLLASPFAFTPEAVYEGEEYLKHSQWNLYEWSAGQLALVNVLPEAEGGEPTRGPQPSVRLADGSVVESVPVAVNPSAISSDGRRVAWDLGVPGEGGSYEGLFVRDMVDEDTVKVSGPNGVFQWMSSDGSRVFFLEGGDLHECEIIEVASKISCVYSDLTTDHAAGESSGGVQELVSDVSQDGSYVYFVAQGVLANATGAVSGEDNLYLLHDRGGAWSTTYIATLSPEDENDWFSSYESGLPDISRVSSRVSPDGRYLAFMSDRPLTGYDNTDAVSGHADEEVYLYDAEAGRLACASCDPTGARPLGVLDPRNDGLLVDRNRAWTGFFGVADPWLAGSIPGWDVADASGSSYQPRYLSDSGRLFFDSPDGLVPRATNGVEDVYEYEPAGVGDCTEGVSSGATVYAASAGGCVGLMSAGTSGQESAFFDASESGDDVFFVSEAKLVGADKGNSYAVYDAHVCGSEGVACASEPERPPPCSSGDSCKAAPSPQPEIFGSAPSATFAGTGNVVEAAAPKAVAKAKAKPRTRAQKLAKALKVCKRDKSKTKRAACARKARRAYGRSR